MIVDEEAAVEAVAEMVVLVAMAVAVAVMVVTVAGRGHVVGRGG